MPKITQNISSLDFWLDLLLNFDQFSQIVFQKNEKLIFKRVKLISKELKLISQNAKTHFFGILREWARPDFAQKKSLAIC